MIKNLILVSIGGGLGSAFRYLAGLLISRQDGFPTATFIVNIIGSFVIGLLIARLLQSPNETIRLLLIVGFCGGFTTFSAFSAETFQLLQNGSFATALLYVLGSVLLGLLAMASGYLLMR